MQVNAQEQFAGKNLTDPERSLYARLVWTTMISLDNANRTGDYSILHALGAAGFKSNNSVGGLYDTFRAFRESQTDIGRTILIEPTYYLPPETNREGMLRLRGGFETRPMAIRFDILFQKEAGAWKIFALSVVEQKSSLR